jgi:hypothetical protein
MVPLAEVPHGLIEPLDLISRFGANDTAPHHVLKHLIASLFEHRWLDNLSATTRLLFCHEFLEWG